jgi:hypothetical protein
VQVGDTEDVKDVDWDDLEDDTDEATFTPVASGLKVSPDNTLYVASSAMGGSGAQTDIYGTLVVQGCLSGATCIDDIYDWYEDDWYPEVTRISGEFICGEVVATTSTALWAGYWVDDGGWWIDGYVTVKGNISHALGRVEVSLFCGDEGLWEEGETVKVINSSLVVDSVVSSVEGQADGVARLILHEDDSLWELDGTKLELEGLYGLWLSLAYGSNFLWTITDYTDINSFEDTIFGPVIQSSPKSGTALDRLAQVSLAWKKLGCAKYYEYEYDSTVVESGKEKTSATVKNLDSAKTYKWKVRVSDPLHSRWSGQWSFTTALGAPEWRPALTSPLNGATNVSLTPTFCWESADWATGYDFTLSDNYFITEPIVSQQVLEEVYALEAALDYDTTYYWKVRAYSASGHSHWSDGGVFTTMSEALPPPPAPTPPAPAPAPQVTVQVPEAPIPTTPVYVWVIIGIGAALVVVVIVLIVRTRRAL